MKKLSPIALAIALAFPMVANAAASNADLQKEIEMLKAQLAELKQMVVKQAAAPVAPAVSSGDVALRAEVAAMRVKMDAMEDAHEANGFAGVKLSGYIDPTYIYSKRAGRGDFIFLNGDDGTPNNLASDSWGYGNSNFGGATIKIEKTFENNMTATLKLRPYKSTNNTWVEEAFASVPVGDGLAMLVGKMNSFNGYEYVDAPDIKNVTHNLLWDFGGPLEMTGVGLTFHALGADWKTIAGNMNEVRDNVSKANHNRGFHWRADWELNEFFGVGASGMHGSLYGQRYHYAEADFWYTRGDWTFNGQLEGSQHKNSAFNGKDASHIGLSGLAALNLGDGWEAVVRADWLDDSKNGGWRGAVEETGAGECLGLADLENDPTGATPLAAGSFCGDYRNGFSPNVKFDAASGVWGITRSDRGSKRSALTFGLNYLINENATLKFEVRHDMSNNNSFYDWKDKDFKKSNTTIGAQTVVKF